MNKYFLRAVTEVKACFWRRVENWRLTNSTWMIFLGIATTLTMSSLRRKETNPCHYLISMTDPYNTTTLQLVCVQQQSRNTIWWYHISTRKSPCLRSQPLWEVHPYPGYRLVRTSRRHLRERWYEQHPICLFRLSRISEDSLFRWNWLVELCLGANTSLAAGMLSVAEEEVSRTTREIIDTQYPFHRRLV